MTTSGDGATWYCIDPLWWGSYALTLQLTGIASIQVQLLTKLNYNGTLDHHVNGRVDTEWQVCEMLCTVINQLISQNVDLTALNNCQWKQSWTETSNNSPSCLALYTWLCSDDYHAEHSITKKSCDDTTVTERPELQYSNGQSKTKLYMITCSVLSAMVSKIGRLGRYTIDYWRVCIIWCPLLSSIER